jgi:hypothetical protein
MAAYAVVLLLLALIPAFIARHRGHGFWTFYVFGLLLWIVALPVALLIKDRRRHCPYCIDPIEQSASVCPHCRKELGPPVLQASTV